MEIPSEVGFRAYSVGLGVPWLGNLFRPGRVKGPNICAVCSHDELFEDGCSCGVHYVRSAEPFVDEVLRYWSEYRFRVREPLLTIAGALSLGVAFGRCEDDPGGLRESWGGEVPRRTGRYQMKKLYLSARCLSSVDALRSIFQPFGVDVHVVDPRAGYKHLANLLADDSRTLLGSEMTSVASDRSSAG